MKRNCTIAIIYLILPFFVLAQTDTTSKNVVDTTAKPKTQTNGFAFGIKLGLNYNKIDGLEFSEGYKTGFHFGCFAEIGKGMLGFQPELVFSQAGTTISKDTASVFETGTRLKLSYIQIPLLLRLRLGKIFTLSAGPQLGFLINTNKNETESGEKAFKSTDYAMDFGAQVNFGNLRFYGRYCIGLSDISDLNDQESWKNQVFQLGLGIKVF